MQFGFLRLKDFLEKTGGSVRGRLLTDAKDRYYTADYTWQDDLAHPGYLLISRAETSNPPLQFPASIVIDEALVAFFGLYSGDGAKGSESTSAPGRVHPPISFSQTEPHLVKFAIEQFRKIFGTTIAFAFSVGEDSAYFMGGAGAQRLKAYYDDAIPPTPDLHEVRPEPNEKDKLYLQETRTYQHSVAEDLAFYYFHQSAMESLLVAPKREELASVGIILSENDSISASLRRPYKKGAREPGGSSRADELVLKGATGMGELFLKMLHEIETSILDDTQFSPQGLVEWNAIPSSLGEVVNVHTFFTQNSYGQIAGQRPFLSQVSPSTLTGHWKGSNETSVSSHLHLDPLWCYVAGLYLAEGTSDKATLFSMFRQKPDRLALSFTSSEGVSLELFIRALERLFPEFELDWKIKVGSQYFPELVVVGLKLGVPMLRGGIEGQGKLRTMEISLAIKDWALKVAPFLQGNYANAYTHVEPTGAGVPRIHCTVSSALCRWYFPLLMYSVFGQIAPNPGVDFAGGRHA